jgi:anthranilate synthase
MASKRLLKDLDTAAYTFPPDMNSPGDTALGFRLHATAARDHRHRSGGGVSPLNQRGEMLNQILLPVLEGHPHWDSFGRSGSALRGRLRPLPKLFSEEERSKQPSAFSILRALIEEFRHPEDSRLALIGAFGFDLLFQFEPIEKKLPRAGHKDLHLFFCDDIYSMDRKKEQIERYQWDLNLKEAQRADGTRGAGPRPNRQSPQQDRRALCSDHTPEEYMANVETVRAGMARGDYYEVVLRQTFRAVRRQAFGAVSAHAAGQSQSL